MPVRARAYAKINLLLAVGPGRPDGYHEVLSLLQSVGLHDTLDLAFAPAGAPSLRLRCAHPEVPCDGRNLVGRAIAAFRAEFGAADPLRVTLDKGIPVAAGLAGGSADAAATLLALAQLYHLPGGDGRLAALAERLGADVPFCLTGGTARAEGSGERLTPLPAHPGIWLVLWTPPGGVGTAEVYARLEEIRTVGPEWTGRPAAEARLAAAAEALAAGDLAALGRVLTNDLALVTEEWRPEVREARERFLAAGAPGALMSGSGPTVFALAGSEEAAGRLAAAVKELPGEIYLTRTVGRGIQLDAGRRRRQKETRVSSQK
jgi:4-diphosphocytidyl-2-C-methyl-D-erythritol kinase